MNNYIYFSRSGKPPSIALEWKDEPTSGRFLLIPQADQLQLDNAVPFHTNGSECHVYRGDRGDSVRQKEVTDQEWFLCLDWVVAILEHEPNREAKPPVGSFQAPVPIIQDPKGQLVWTCDTSRPGAAREASIWTEHQIQCHWDPLAMRAQYVMNALTHTKS